MVDAYANSVKSVLLGTDPIGYSGCCAALRDFDFTRSMTKIRIPTLVIAGDRDVSTPWEGHGQLLANNIPDAQSAAPHGVSSCRIWSVRYRLPRHYSIFCYRRQIRPPIHVKEGFAVRRAVLGDAHVDRSIAGATDFTRDFQSLITRYAWGTIWTRPGLNRRTRRLAHTRHRGLFGAMGRVQTARPRAGLST